MKPTKEKTPKWWIAIFLAIPILYFAMQFLPYYHSGGTVLPSLGSIYWYPVQHEQAISFIALFYPGFRINELTSALLSTQLFAIFLIILTPILKSKSAVAFLLGSWGVLGLITFLTTRSLTFSPVLVYGGFASILMLLLFVAAIAAMVMFFYPIYKTYRINYAIVYE